MTWASEGRGSERFEQGDVSLVEASSRADQEAAAVRAGLAVVPVEAPRPALRGRLALLIESAVESELERRGAPPPGVGASSDLDASLSDQLCRARLAGASGLAISVGSLEGIASLGRALDAEDSAVLRWWLGAARKRPVCLILDATDSDIGVYPDPLPLHAVLSGRGGEPGHPEPPEPAPEVAASSRAMELSELPPLAEQGTPVVVTQEESAQSPQPIVTRPSREAREENDAEALMRAMAQIFADVEPISTGAGAEPISTRADVDPVSAEADVEPISTGADVEPISTEADDAQSCTSNDAMSPGAMSPEDDATYAFEPASGDTVPPAPAEAEPTGSSCPAVEQAGEMLPKVLEPDPTPVSAQAPVRRQSGPLDPNAPTEWQRWAKDLEATRGPKPLAVIERTFVTSFVPLMDACSRGIAGPEALPLLEAWSRSFEKSYSEAFEALRMRGKRPTMVLDVPDIALRIGRLHGARTAQLILVDGMRFDLGLRIDQRVKPFLAEHAALTERLLLWSALPTTTAVQLELLGRGPQGLKERSDETASEVPVARGRAAATLRRVRAGQREVLKLDLIESAMSVPGGPLAERLDDLADEAAEVLANHLLRLPPRTLAVIFADHGFALESIGAGTSAARSGGASPEEVLVPAFAWLCGSMH